MADRGATIVELIEAKRDGLELDDDSLNRVIDSYTSGTMPDYQMSALLMAIVKGWLSLRPLMADNRSIASACKPLAASP